MRGRGFFGHSILRFSKILGMLSLTSSDLFPSMHYRKFLGKIKITLFSNLRELLAINMVTMRSISESILDHRICLISHLTNQISTSSDSTSPNLQIQRKSNLLANHFRCTKSYGAFHLTRQKPRFRHRSSRIRLSLFTAGKKWRSRKKTV